MIENLNEYGTVPQIPNDSVISSILDVGFILSNVFLVFSQNYSQLDQWTEEVSGGHCATLSSDGPQGGLGICLRAIYSNSPNT